VTEQLTDLAKLEPRNLLGDATAQVHNDVERKGSSRSTD
jgi:hypothetical protein